VTEILFGPDVAEGQADLLAVPLLAERTPGPGAEWSLAQLGDGIDAFLDGRDFSGKAGQAVVVPTSEGGYGAVALLGLGDEADAESLRRAAGTLGRMASRYPSVATTLHLVDVDGAVEAVTLGYLLGGYHFDKYRSEPKPTANEQLMLLGASSDVDDEVEAGRAVADGVLLARDLINEPAGGKPPTALAAMAEELSDRVDVEVFDEAAIAEAGFGGLMAVAAGAANPARMVVFRYEPADPVAYLAFVGKGIVFDSGGLSLKPPKAMETMKTDMSGAAAVFGAVKAIATLGLPVRVLGITPLTENMPGGSAQRPGDVMRAYGGKTIEVLNTDAEGRLVLADALALAAEAEPDLVVDVATLTGACQIALGLKIAGLWGNDEAAVEQVEAAARFAGEKVWEMPLETEYRSMIDSDIADMTNTAERPAGAITAALLLSEFVSDQPWVHLDIAGPARSAKDEYYLTKGGSGFGVRTLVALARQAAQG
jgi:leucyl aminopeptidase